MELTEKQIDATASALDACLRLGLYTGLGLGLEDFRHRRCAEVVEACQQSCPLSPANLGTRLLTFLTRLIGNLEELGYQPQVSMRFLCAVRQTDNGLVEWSWANWCDHVARNL